MSCLINFLGNIEEKYNMNIICDEYFKIESKLNDSIRDFFDLVSEKGINWTVYLHHEKMVNKYYKGVNVIIKSYNINWKDMITSNDSIVRLVSLKLIRDGFKDIYESMDVMNQLILLAMKGNDEEKLIARNITASENEVRKIDDNKINEIINPMWNNMDYYLYKDIGDFLILIKNNNLLAEHVKKGIKSLDEDIIELANEFNTR